MRKFRIALNFSSFAELALNDQNLNGTKLGGDRIWYLTGST
jgi:hypothetical protein